MRHKIILITYLTIGLALEAYCQEKVESTNSYKTAYAHILASSEFKEFAEGNKCVTVFDSIVYLDRVTFNTQFDIHKKYSTNNNEYALIDSLNRIDIANKHKPYFYSPVAALTRRLASKRHCIVVIFSKLSDNWLIAEVIQNDNGGKSLRHIMPVFGQSLRYLIFFDEKNKIEKSAVVMINYN